MTRIVISSCLLGAPCRYDGGSKPVFEPACARLVKRLCAHGGPQAVTEICPELLGGLGCPREPAERVGARVLTRTGLDVTHAYTQGARRSLTLACQTKATLAILKSKSPACGSGCIYDGSFSGRMVSGDGVAAEILKREGVTVVDEQTITQCEPSFEHPVAIVLGSGLGPLADLVRPERHIPYSDIEGFPQAAHPVAGHGFTAIVGRIDGVPVVVYPGRIHLYQGFTAQEITCLVRHAYKLGCRDLILSCASGAVHKANPGSVGLITDQINLTGTNPLVYSEVVAAAGLDTPFVPMAGAYSAYLQQLARDAADEAGIALSEGTYAGLLGPTYETAAEIRALEALGADYVGMSMVCEAIMAQALGMSLLGLTIVTNQAGRADNCHEEVLEAAAQASQEACVVVRKVLARLGSLN